MPDYSISQKDLRDAENFLVQFQKEMIPEANLEKGGAVRDLLIKGFSYMYAFLRGEIDRVAVRQSLLRIQEELTDEDDISQAVDELLSNWFLSRKSGENARMTARLHFTEKRSQSIPVTTKFWRTSVTVFYLDSDSDFYVISPEQLFPIFDTTGTLLDYIVDVPLVAAKSGTGYNITPGTFVRVEAPGGLPYFSYAENTEDSTDGKNIESSTELISRAETAISVRNLINNRSCDSTLQEEFTTITETLTIGMGEAEMVRDRRVEVASHIRLHVGGHYDTYVTLPLTTVEESGVIGGYFTRPDGIAAVFRDPELTHDDGKTFKTVLEVQPGHILYIRDGIVGTPRGYQIVRVDDHELEVSVNTAFTEASDEADTNAVQYSIGWLSPGFEEIDFGGGSYQRTAMPSVAPAYENVPYGTSRRTQQPGCIMLSGKPIQELTWVEITDPTAGDILIDPSTDTLIFHNRINMTPVLQVEPAYTQYQLQVTDFSKAQSMNAVNIIRVGYASDPTVFDGKTLRVVYKTLAGVSGVHNYVVNRNQRVACANQLVRARNPVWIEFEVPYRLSKTATEEFDTADAAKTLAEHINNFDPNDDLDVSDVQAFLRENYTMLGAVFPLEIYYYLDAPDGQQAAFSTTDIVSIFMTSSNGATLENSDEITPPQDLINRGITGIVTASNVLDWFEYLGVSDRTVHYRTTEEMISFVLR